MDQRWVWIPESVFIWRRQTLRLTVCFFCWRKRPCQSRMSSDCDHKAFDVKQMKHDCNGSVIFRLYIIPSKKSPRLVILSFIFLFTEKASYSANFYRPHTWQNNLAILLLWREFCTHRNNFYEYKIEAIEQIDRPTPFVWINIWSSQTAKFCAWQWLSGLKRAITAPFVP